MPVIKGRLQARCLFVDDVMLSIPTIQVKAIKCPGPGCLHNGGLKVTCAWSEMCALVRNIGRPTCCSGLCEVSFVSLHKRSLVGMCEPNAEAIISERNSWNISTPHTPGTLSAQRVDLKQELLLKPSSRTTETISSL